MQTLLKEPELQATWTSGTAACEYTRARDCVINPFLASVFCRTASLHNLNLHRARAM